MDHDSGHSYHKKGRNGAKTYIECGRKNIYNCPARGYILKNKITWTKDHRHVPNLNANKISHFRQQLRANVASSLEDLRVVYDKTCGLYPSEGVLVPFQRMESSMLRWRRKYRPPTPTNLVEYANIVNMDEWKHLVHYTGGNLSISTVSIDDGSQVTIIKDIQFLSLLQVEELYLDATFKVCPRIPKIHQMLTIMTRVDAAVIPIAWALMTRKTTASYVAVLRHFARDSEHIQPIAVMVDYEQALTSAIRIIYPRATINHCYFHFTQALVKHLGKRGDTLCIAVQKRDDVKIFIRKLMALPLLPADCIAWAFNWVKSNATEEIRHLSRNFLDYLQHYWLERVTPQNFSVFGMTHRTNNAIEAYHRIMSRKTGSHPSIWKLTHYLVNLQCVTRVELTTINMGQPIRRPLLKKYADFENFLQRAWYLFNINALDTIRFLACANHMIRAFKNKYLITNIRQIDTFVYAQNHDNSIHPAVRGHDINIARDANVIRILQPNHEFSEIQLLHNLESSRCAICLERVSNHVSLPCSHWFGCRHCCAKYGRMAVRERADLRCSVCGEIIVGFKRIQIT